MTDEKAGPGRPKIADHKLLVGLTASDLEQLDAYCASWEIEDAKGQLRPLNRSEGVRQLIRLSSPRDASAPLPREVLRRILAARKKAEGVLEDLDGLEG